MFKQVLRYKVKRWVLVCAACLALFAGVVWARLYGLDNAWLLWAIVPFIVISLRRHSVLALILVCAVAFGVGWWRGNVYMQKLDVHESLHYQNVVLTGTATEDAVYGQRYQLEFSMSNVQVAEPFATPLVGNITARGFGEPAIYRGDTVQVSGKLYPTLGNNLASVSFAELKVVERDTSWLNKLRREFAAGMLSALPEPMASFGLGLLIGQRTTLPQTTEDELRYVGLTHIVAVSGYNLTVIVLMCRRLLAKRSKYQATIVCLTLIGVFLLITGSTPPIVRASIISLLGIGAWYYGRRIKPLTILLVGAAITVAANPIYLWSSVSWYLSFLAFFGVLILAPLLTRRLFGNKEPHLLISILIESACASVLVLPYILYIFGETSLVSLPANLLVVPFIPIAMLLALVAGLAGMWSPVVAGWFAWPAKALLTYMLDIAALLARVPNAFLTNIGFGLPAMLASYAIIIVLCLLLWGKVRIKRGILTDKKAVLLESKGAP